MTTFRLSHIAADAIKCSGLQEKPKQRQTIAPTVGLIFEKGEKMRAIDADALLKEWEPSEGCRFDAELFTDSIKDAPTIEAIQSGVAIFRNDEAPRLHNKWIFEGLTMFGDLRVRCSVCGYKTLQDAEHKHDYNFCPNCGARTQQDPKKRVLFECDPEKNTECSKTCCYIIGGECRLTTKPEYRREAEP